MGILTEEELKEIEDKNALFHPFKFHRVMNDIDNVIASHRSLLSANAELNFKNMELQEENKKMSGAIDALQQQMWEGI